MYGMNSDFDRALNRLTVAILDFELSNFTSKDNVPSKAPHAWGECPF